MTEFHVTEQEASVIERTYSVVADSAEAAQDYFESMSDDKDELLVHTEVVRTNVEIVNVAPVT